MVTLRVWVRKSGVSPSMVGMGWNHNKSLPSQSNTRPNILHPSLWYQSHAPSLQEMASYGLNPVCIIGLAIFVLFNVPIISHKFSVILTFRFFTRFTGSPVLAVSTADIFPGSKLPYVIGICALDAVGGSIFGPIIVSPIYTLKLYITDTAQRADSQFKLKVGNGQSMSSSGYQVSHSFSSLSFSQRCTRPISY